MSTSPLRALLETSGHVIRDSRHGDAPLPAAANTLARAGPPPPTPTEVCTPWSTGCEASPQFVTDPTGQVGDGASGIVGPRRTRRCERLLNRQDCFLSPCRLTVSLRSGHIEIVT